MYHNDDNVTRAIFNALGDNGVLTSRLRESDHSYNDPAIYTFIDTLIDEGFESINIYSELYGRFDTRWTFFVGMKDFSSKSNWMKTESEIEIAIRHRIVSTISGGSPFQYFDGATMKSYEFIERVVENKWCIQFPERCKIGHGFDPEIPNVAQSMFDVGNSNIAIGGRGVFAKEYIKKGSYIGLEECVHGMFIPSMTYELMHNSAKHFENNNEFLQCLTIGYLDGYVGSDTKYDFIRWCVSKYLTRLRFVFFCIKGWTDNDHARILIQNISFHKGAVHINISQ